MSLSTSKIASPSSDSENKRLRRIAWVIAFGVLLNPLNSSMIAVALLRIGDEFQVDVATVTWLISGYYLAGAVGPSLVGKLSDLFGAKRLFTVGLTLVIVSSLLTAWAPSFGALLALRIVQALGSTVAFPAGMSILRSVSPRNDRQGSSKGIASALGLISVTANVMAAFGPTLGGFLVGYVSWYAIFWINIPIAILVLLFARSWLPADPIHPRKNNHKGQPSSSVWQRIDLPGILLFTITLTALMLFLLSLSTKIYWILLVIATISAYLLYQWERRAISPFLNIRMLTSNPRLLSVFLQYAGVNVVFYALFFCLPLWFDQVKEFSPKTAGLLMLPFAGFGVIMTPVAIRMIKRSGYRSTVMIGNVVLILGTLILLLLDDSSPIPFILLVTAILGIPNGLNNMGLQTALYEVTAPEETGIASGLFQTFRSIGCILSTSLLGLTFGGTVTTSGLHTIALITAGLGVALLLANRSGRRT